MSLKCGIVGLPNVGKSTLFNALCGTAKAEAANYPFCTIEPNNTKITVPDERLKKLADIAGSAQIIPVQIEFVDIAGLVKGASKGEGLGNKFLSHIREVDIIINVVRCFEDGDITHTEGRINPVLDLELIQTELILADLESLEKRLPNLEKKAKNTKDKYLLAQIDMAKKALVFLNEGKSASLVETADKEEEKVLKELQLITSKPQLLVGNLKEEEINSDNEFYKELEKFANSNNINILKISAKIEAEIASLEDELEKTEFLETIGLEETGLSQIVKASYKLLDLITFFTVGPKECHAWNMKNNLLAPQAAGVIHSDFETGFIKAQTISYQDYVDLKGEEGAKNAGKLRLEGKDYKVEDGDIFHFRFNV